MPEPRARRLEESPSGAVSSTVADSAGTSDPGTYDGMTDGPSASPPAGPDRLDDLVAQVRDAGLTVSVHGSGGGGGAATGGGSVRVPDRSGAAATLSEPAGLPRDPYPRRAGWTSGAVALTVTSGSTGWSKSRVGRCRRWCWKNARR